MSRVLAADNFTKKGRELYGYSHYALALLAPAACVTPDGSVVQKVVDWGLVAAIPLHSHVAINAVVSDYVPKVIRGPARAGVLAGTGAHGECADSTTSFGALSSICSLYFVHMNGHCIYRHEYVISIIFTPRKYTKST